ncbi:MAG: sugar ABC transporter permease [Elusimicrobiota bacterium]|jgi:ABC-type sugar transport system permease subunit|nr:sugar ABC transporter permease [Elusimicrobiota bacterium]
MRKKIDILQDIFTSYLFVIPALILFFIFSLYPIFKVFEISFFNWDGIAINMRFIGFDNFKEVLSNKIWWQSVFNATYITILALIFQNSLALFLAFCCDRDIKGAKAYRVIFYLPPVLSGIVVGLIWNWIYDGSYGLFNHIISMIGLGDLTRAWLADPKTALIAVAIIHMWKGFGWGFVILLAGLQGISRDYYEAATIDGASSFQTFMKITVPLMIPIFFLVSILTILGTMQIYDLIISTTQGGPGYHTEVPVTRILAAMTGTSRFGYACAMSLVFGTVLLFLSIFQLKISKKIENR